MTAACTPRQRDARAVRTVVFQLTRKLRVTYRINPQRRVSRLLALAGGALLFAGSWPCRPG
jgi:hypothetical protein